MRPLSDKMPRESYLCWIGRCAKEMRRALSEGGSLFLNMGEKPTDSFLPMDVAQEFRYFFELQNVFHWVKSISLDEQTSHGHYRPINSERFVNSSHEYIFHFTKGGYVTLDRLAVGVEYADKTNEKRWGNGALRCRGNNWYIPYETTQSKNNHPATFPVGLPDMCLKIHGIEKIKLVCDPFMGSGTTAVAATRYNLDFVGLDVCSEYVEMANRRLLENGYAGDIEATVCEDGTLMKVFGFND